MRIPLLLLFLFGSLQASGLRGIFDAGWSTYYFGQDSINHLYTRLAAMHINEVVLQYGIVEGQHRYYPSTLSFAQNAPDHSTLFPQSITAAHQAGTKLWLGLYYDDKTWWTPPTHSQLANLATRNIAMLHELHSLYGNDTSITGVYIPQEIARYYWQTDSALNELTQSFLKPVTDTAHFLGFKVMAAPFFNSALETPTQLHTFMQSLLGQWHPDIINIQDGIGANHACVQSDVEFSVDVELFSGSTLASKDRIEAQIDSAYANKAAEAFGYDLSVLGDDGLLQLMQWQTDFTDTPSHTRMTISPPSFHAFHYWHINGTRVKNKVGSTFDGHGRYVTEGESTTSISK